MQEAAEIKAIQEALATVKKLGFGEISLKVTNSRLTYIETIIGQQIQIPP